MKFKLYKNYGALNSVPVFEAFANGVRACGHEIVEDSEDVAVIWSVLWNGRMAGNQQIYNACVKQNKPVVVIEVGNLKRGLTWRISEGHINGIGTCILNIYSEYISIRIKLLRVNSVQWNKT